MSSLARPACRGCPRRRDRGHEPRRLGLTDSLELLRRFLDGLIAHEEDLHLSGGKVDPGAHDRDALGVGGGLDAARERLPGSIEQGSRQEQRPIAAFSDVHGNSAALTAVFLDASWLGPSELWALGNYLYGPRPASVVEAVRLCHTCLAGASELAVAADGLASDDRVRLVDLLTRQRDGELRWRPVLDLDKEVQRLERAGAAADCAPHRSLGGRGRARLGCSGEGAG